MHLKLLRPSSAFLNFRILYDQVEILVMDHVVHTVPESLSHPPGLRYQSLPAGGAHRMCAHSSLQDHTRDTSQKITQEFKNYFLTKQHSKMIPLFHLETNSC